MVQLHSYPCIHKMNTLNLALTRFNILKSGGTSKNNEHKLICPIQSKNHGQFHRQFPA